MGRLSLFLVVSTFFCSPKLLAQGEPFAAKRVVNAATAAGRFRHPFAMVMGPDDSLWVTERRGYVIKVNRVNGGKKTLLDIHNQVRFTTSVSGGNVTGISQDGMFGIALHPDLNKGKGNDYVYLAYCYDSSGKRRTKIVRYNYNRAIPNLTGEVTLLKGIPASNDHNSGRLVIGNFGTVAVPDYKLVYTVGDQGANQFSNACDTIQSQYIPTAAQMSAGNLLRYCGKIIRLNLDGSIPADNPVINGIRTHIWSYGHRNPQGLTFQKDINGVLIPKGKLYSTEQGPATDDEVNIIDSGNNYGWPRIAGKRDNNWYKYFKWATSGSCSSYGGECSTNQTSTGLVEFSFSDPRYTDPIFDMYPGIPPGGSGCNWLTNPTVAPSSVIYYYGNAIPGWNNCLLITTLKTSALLRLRLNVSGTGIVTGTDTIKYFKDPSALNRFRDIALGADGTTIYVLTDSVGATSGPSAGTDGGVTDRGSILEYRYTGALLALGEDPVYTNESRLSFRMYPNPVSKVLFVESKANMIKPLNYRLYDAEGKAVLTGTSRKDKFNVNVEKLKRGIYFMKVYNGYDINVAIEKIIVN